MRTREQIKSELDGANATVKAAKAKAEEIEQELQRHDLDLEASNVQLKAQRLVGDLYGDFLEGHVRIEGCHVGGGVDGSIQSRFDLQLIDGARFTITKRTYR